MLGDLRAKLEPIGRLDALDGVGSRVLAYYSKQDTSELSDAGLVQRSRALNLTAEVAYLRGNYPEAEQLYRQAAAGTAEAVRRSPDDTSRIFDHAQNIFWLGELARFQGNTSEAFARYSEYKRLGDRLVQLEPDNIKWRMESLYGGENVGIALYGQRKFAEASRSFEDALQPIESLASVDRRNPTYSKELSTVLAWIADAQRAQGSLEPATVTRQRQIAILNGMVASGARDVEVRQYLIPAHQALGNLLEWRGQLNGAMDELQAAVSEADQLIPVEPKNALWKSLGAHARLDLARVFFESGRHQEAQQQTDIACGTVSALRSADSHDSLLVTLQTSCLTTRARLALQSGAIESAASLARQALASARKEHSGDTVRDRYVVAGAYRLVGEVQQRAGDAGGANASWSQALAILPRGITEKPNEMSEHAMILQRLGRGAEAQPLISRLEAIDYRRLT
jgi:tetratricopeptide (TPR) repeat protein